MLQLSFDETLYSSLRSERIFLQYDVVINDEGIRLCDIPPTRSQEVSRDQVNFIQTCTNTLRGYVRLKGQSQQIEVHAGTGTDLLLLQY